MSPDLALFFQLTVSGLASGSIYALVALGFVIIYKSTEVLNFAQGELMMIGAYISFSLITQFKVGFIPALFITVILAALLGVLVEFFVLKKMVGEPIFSTIMITIGLAVVLRGLVGLVWGHADHRLETGFFSDKPFKFASIVISEVHVWTVVSSLVLMMVFFIFFKVSRLGIGMRASAENQDAALLMGISARQTFALAWAASAIVSAVGGILLSQISFMHPGMSFVGLNAFPAVILGGLDSMVGGVIGGFIIGIVENLSGGYLDQYIGGGFKQISTFIVLLIFLMVRPYGLFGTKEIEKV